MNWQNFPSLHPLIVHFPIVLLLAVPLLIVLWMYTKNEAYLWMSRLSALTGALGAIVASELIHPRAGSMPEVVIDILFKHDEWAETTTSLAIASFVLLLAPLIPQAKKFYRFLKPALLLLALSAAIAVSITGHYGAMLTHVHGVGAEGKYLIHQEKE